MDALVVVMLLAAAVAGGALNAVAGGGSFLTFPALLFAGVLPVQANATSTVALWPGSVSGALGYRRDLRRASRALVVALAAAAVVGGLAGALVLLHTSQSTFRRLVPWLLLLATVVFASGPVVTRKLAERHLRMPAPVLVALQLAISTYGGYFGGGMGIMMLASYSAMGLEDVHVMNAIKTVMAVVLNAVAIVAFVVAGIVEWPQALLMAAASLAGGWLGAHYARRVPGAWMRAFVILVGLVLSAYFFVR